MLSSLTIDKKGLRYRNGDNGLYQFKAVVVRAALRGSQHGQRASRVVSRGHGSVPGVATARGRASLPHFSSNMFLFLDECSVDDRTNVRGYGYFKKGHNLQQPKLKNNFVRRNRKSVLAGLDETGIIGSQVIDGSFTTELFNSVFEQEFLPLLGQLALGEDCSIVVLDNCRIHDSNELIEMVRNKGAVVHFLPPYSPDMNPIEFCFGFLKQYLKRHYGSAMKDSRLAIYDALEGITPEHARDYFACCGYY